MTGKINGASGGEGTNSILVSKSTEDGTHDSPPLYLRTVRAFGIFPSALLLSGYGENEVEKYRTWVASVDDGVGGMVERKMEMSTESNLGLPRGSDPLVLVGLLKLLFDRGVHTNSVSFKKQELLSLLGWQPNADTRKAIEGALARYYAASYRGVNLWTTGEKVKRRDQMRRLIISYEVVDERKVRYQAERASGELETELLFTRVELHPDLINEIRQFPLAIDFNLLCSLTSHLARRLFEVLNLCADAGQSDFDFDVRELAHERLGLSRAFKAPSQCWTKIRPSFEKLAQGGYLAAYDYHKETCRVTGTISDTHMPTHFAPMEPLPKILGRREVLQKRLRAIGTFENVAKGLLDAIPETLLDKVEFVVNYIEVAKAEGRPSRSYNHGGWAVKELKHIRDHGELSPTLVPPHEDGGDGREAAGDDTGGPPPEYEAVGFEPDETTPAAEQLWGRVIEACGKELPQQSVETWFRPVRAARLQGHELTLIAPNQVVRDWVSSNYSTHILSALAWAGGAEGEDWTLDWMVSARLKE
jgi:hypothetical protein